MRLKHICIILVTAVLLCGCQAEASNTFEAPQNSSVEFVEHVVNEDTQQISVGEYDGIPLSHALQDNSIMFSEKVSVIPYTVLESYNGNSHIAVLKEGYTVGNSEYAYLIYSPSQRYIFQRITNTEKQVDGTTIIYLSGIEAQEELDEKSFMSLIVEIDLRGEEGYYNENDNSSYMEDGDLTEDEESYEYEEPSEDEVEPLDENLRCLGCLTISQPFTYLV